MYVFTLTLESLLEVDGSMGQCSSCIQVYASGVYINCININTPFHNLRLPLALKIFDIRGFASCMVNRGDSDCFFQLSTITMYFHIFCIILKSLVIMVQLNHQLMQNPLFYLLNILTNQYRYLLFEQGTCTYK